MEMKENNSSKKLKKKGHKKSNHKHKTNAESQEKGFSQNWKKFIEERDSLKENNKNLENKIRNRHLFKRKPKRKHESSKTESSESDVKKVKTEIVASNSNLTCESVVKDGLHTKYIAIDCEMVGIGINAKENALARVSLVNSKGECIYDTYVKPKEKVVDYRTEVSGIRPINLKDALSYETVQKEVYDILKDKIIVGHALQNDLKVLMLSHSRRQIRDTQKYKPLQQLLKTKKPALRKLASAVLNETIQAGEHSSIIDARATMRLYQKYKKDWEKSLRTKKQDNNNKKEIFMGHSKDDGRKTTNIWKKRKLKKQKE